VIRKAVPADAMVVRDIVWAAYAPYVPVIGMKPGPMTDDYPARIIADQVWVLEDSGVPAAVLVLEELPDCFLLDNIAVRPDRQGSGYGRVLLDFAEAEAGRQGWDAITLYTNALMTQNIAIYAKRGYVERERRREKGFDRVYMIKALNRPTSSGDASG
jgi:GNAT superfamily N-acetyltransferase